MECIHLYHQLVSYSETYNGVWDVAYFSGSLLLNFTATTLCVKLSTSDVQYSFYVFYCVADAGDDMKVRQLMFDIKATESCQVTSGYLLYSIGLS